VSTAHIFYIPILVLVGVFAGYFIGRHMAEVEEFEKRKKARRRAALENRAPNAPADESSTEARSD